MKILISILIFLSYSVLSVDTELTTDVITLQADQQSCWIHPYKTQKHHTTVESLLHAIVGDIVFANGEICD
jgi:hypothetical protein